MTLKATNLEISLYQQWASHRLLKVIEPLSTTLYYQNLQLPYPSIHKSLNHLIAAHQLWQFRLAGEANLPSSLTHIFHEHFEETAETLKKHDVFWIHFLHSQSDKWFGGETTFTLQDGRSFHFPNQLLLAHFWNHQSLIRGQLQAALQQQKIACPTLEMVNYLMENGLNFLNKQN